MTVSLITFGKGGVRKDFPIKKLSTVIGRKVDADLRIPLADVSRAHCELTLIDDELTVRDLDSSNGTFVNGEKVEEATLHAGDKLKLGPVVFIVQVDGQPRDVSPAMIMPKPAQPAPAPKPKPAVASPAAATTLRKSDHEDEELDIDALSDMDLDELSDVDMDDIDSEIGSGDLEELDELEELSDEDLLDDDQKK